MDAHHRGGAIVLDDCYGDGYGACVEDREWPSVGDRCRHETWLAIAVDNCGG